MNTFTSKYINPQDRARVFLQIILRVLLLSFAIRFIELDNKLGIRPTRIHLWDRIVSSSVTGQCGRSDFP